MSYKYITNRDSPNFTPHNSVQAVYGRPRTYEAIAIHWWGDPKENPSFGGVVNWLCNPASGASAHFVATGTGRQVAQLVNFGDVSWATNTANPYTISIECDPRCRNEDYDVVAEVIAQIRDAFGDLPLVPHNKFAATRCPGNYDLGRLDKLARTKDGSGKWGVVVNKTTPKPKPPVKPTPPKTDDLYRLVIDKEQKAAYSTDANAYSGYVYYGNKGAITHKGKDVTKAVIDKFKPKPPVIKPEPEPEPKPDEPKKSIMEVLKEAFGVFIQALKDFWNS